MQNPLTRLHEEPCISFLDEQKILRKYPYCSVYRMMEENQNRVDSYQGNSMVSMQCPKGYIFLNDTFQKPCPVKDIGMQEHVECLNKDPQNCKYASPFALMYLCKCPVRIFLSKQLEQ